MEGTIDDLRVMDELRLRGPERDEAEMPVHDDSFDPRPGLAAEVGKLDLPSYQRGVIYADLMHDAGHSEDFVQE